MLSLSRWARIAFAARCAQRSLPMFLAARPDAGSEAVNTLTRVIMATEQSAARASVDLLELREALRFAKPVWYAHNAANTIDLDRAYRKTIFPDSGKPARDQRANRQFVAACSAGVIVEAGRTARSAASRSRAVKSANGLWSDLLQPADAYARTDESLVAQSTLLSNSISADFEVLVMRGQAEKWTNDTPVDPRSLGPLWPNAEPDWSFPPVSD